MRETLAIAARRWSNLSDAQLDAWHAAAAKILSRAVLGESGPLTGHQLYAKINCTLVAAGLPWTDWPPPLPNFGANPVSSLRVTNTGGKIALQLNVSSTPAFPIIVFGAAPVNAGVSCVQHFVILGFLPAPVSGGSDITDLFVAKYGVPRVGSRVFIRTCQFSNGWEDRPMQTNCRVP